MHTPTRFASRLATRLLALGAVAALSLPSVAAPKMEPKMAKMSGSKMSAAPSKTSKKSTQMTGTVLSKTATSLTIKPARKANGASKTISVPATASVMMGKAKSSLAMIKPGEKVTVRMNAAGTVTSVMCTEMGGMKPMKSSKASSKMSGSKMSGSKMGKM